jgi:hypothetical protein
VIHHIERRRPGYGRVDCHASQEGLIVMTKVMRLSDLHNIRITNFQNDPILMIENEDGEMVPVITIDPGIVVLADGRSIDYLEMGLAHD